MGIADHELLPARKKPSVKQGLQQKIFEKIHLQNLVYNTCWEDPRCDRKMLQLDENSRVVMLTSAGCNALDYLLDHPQSIDCVDVNPHQNALLNFKTALFSQTSHNDLFDFFGVGVHPKAVSIYEESLKNALPQGFARQFGEHAVRNYFNGRGLRPSFYWYGSSGLVAYMLKQWLKSQAKTENTIRKFFEAECLDTQKQLYTQIEQKLMGPFFSWFVRQHVVQSMLGVPKSQQRLAQAEYHDGIAGYIRACLRRVFTEISVADNYFWRLYFFGRYLPNCCPEYLKPQNFAQIKSKTEAINTHSMTLNDFLLANPAKYTHFILLDHMDWLAENDRAGLDLEWKLIFANAAPDAKILFRSAAQHADFLPNWVPERLKFDYQAAEISAKNDRVGTYAGTFFAQTLN